MEDLKKLTIEDKPPKLTIEGIRSFFQQGLMLAKRNPQIFLKSLLVSKTFVNTARHFPVYTLVVQHEGNESFSISFGTDIKLMTFEGFHIVGQSSKLAQNSYDRVFKLTKLLDPKHLYMKWSHLGVSNELLEQFEHLLKLIHDGKIGLDLFGSDTVSTLNRLASHLNTLECYFDALKDAEVVSTLNLDHYMTYSTLSKEEFQALLRYKIRRIFVIRIQIDDGHAINELDSEKLQVNSTLQKLEIDDFVGSYESLLGFFDLLKRCSPNLRSLRVSFQFHDAVLCSEGELFEMDEILKNLPAIHQKLKELQDRGVSGSLSKLVIHANSAFRVPMDSTIDRTWPDKLKNCEGFKDIVDLNFDPSYVAFKFEYGSFTLVHHVSIDIEEDIDYEHYRNEYLAEYCDDDYLSDENYDSEYDSEFEFGCAD